MIYSSGKVFTANKYSDESVFDISLGESFGGTAVFMSLSNFSQRQAADVFDQYASVEHISKTPFLPLQRISVPHKSVPD